MRLFLDTKNVRAWPGGPGEYKIGGNYAPTVMPQMAAIAEHKCSQVGDFAEPFDTFVDEEISITNGHGTTQDVVQSADAGFPPFECVRRVAATLAVCRKPALKATSRTGAPEPSVTGVVCWCGACACCGHGSCAAFPSAPWHTPQSTASGCESNYGGCALHGPVTHRL